MPRNTPELNEQISLFQFRDLFQNQYPSLRWLHSSLNGAWLTHKQRSDMSRSGMTSGIPDISLPVCVRKIKAGTEDTLVDYGGLYIELKIRPNKLTKEQEQFFSDARDNGYQCQVCHSWLEAANVILDYLDITDARLRDYLRVNTKAPKPTTRQKTTTHANQSGS